MRDYANQMAQMFVGYQITLDDLPRFIEAGRGQIDVELLSGTTTLDGTPCPPLAISAAVRAWLDTAITRDQLASDHIHRISIHCDFDASAPATAEQPEHLLARACTVELSTADGTWTGSSRQP